MRIIRLEDETGLGVFQCGAAACLPPDLYEHAQIHPTPNLDPVIADAFYGYPVVLCNKWFFAFSSVRQMLDWFPRRALRLLKRRGIRIAVYDCPDEYVVMSECQAIFIRDKATPCQRTREARS